MIMPLVRAKELFGDRLTIAALNALEKSVDEEGCVTVSRIHDGTTGIDLNRFIKVVDACSFPLAPDIKAVVRIQSARGVPLFGLVVDVPDAHRLVAVREEDWPHTSLLVGGRRRRVHQQGGHGARSGSALPPIGGAG